MSSPKAVRLLLHWTCALALAAPLRAQDPPREPGRASADLDAAKQTAQEVGDEIDKIIIVVNKLPAKKKEETPAQGPPSKRELIADEARERLEWLKAIQAQSKRLIEQAERARNPAEAQVLAKDAMLKAETAQRLAQTITGPPPPQPAPANAAAAAAPNGRGIHFQSGALQQLQESDAALSDAVTKRDPAAARQRSNDAFGEGRAGAGGVTLFKTATMLTPLDPSKITRAAVEEGRLLLVYDGKKITFPPFDPQFLAVAIRSVYGGEGLVRGTLLANEDNAVVLRTGKELYGDVAWKKELLPELPQSLTLGGELALDLGPGVGALDLPEPSYGRITYYGPVKANVLGQVMLESDMVFSMFWYGVDWSTGMPLDLVKHPGYQSAIDLDLNAPAAQPPPAPRKEPKNWWEATVWFVWSPDEMTLQLDPSGTEIEFVKSTMRVVVWSVNPDNVQPRSKEEGEFLTKHFDEFAKAFPALAYLREAAKTVSAVRWLKANNVPIDQQWAANYPLTKVLTPERIRRYSVYVFRDKAGKPIVDQGDAESAR